MMTDKQPDTDPYRLYFQLPEDRVDLTKLKMVCLQLSDGTELWFEHQRVAVGLLKRLSKALQRADNAESRIKELEAKLKAILDEQCE